MKKEDYELAVRLNPEAAEIELEWQLASLLYPDYSISYDENGHYWKMNDRRIQGPNFMGFVPKWLRDNDACLRLMSEHRQWPTQLVNGIRFGTDDEEYSCVMYTDMEQPDYMDDAQHHLQVVRRAAVEAIIFVLEAKRKSEKHRRYK